MRNKTNKVLKKWLSVCIALMLTISMALPVQAAVKEGEKHTITVTGKETDANATVAAYRIIKVNFDFEGQQAKDPLYQWEDAVATWLLQNETYKTYVGENNKVTDIFANATAAERSAVMKALGKAVKAETLNLNQAATATIDSNTYQGVLSDLDLGGYLLLTTADPNGKYPDYEYSPITANLLPVYDDESKEWKVEDAEVALKGNPASIEKEADDHTVAIGQTVEYTLNVPVPTYPTDAVAKIFRIGDTLPVGITFAETIQDNKLKVYAVYGDAQEDRSISADSGEFTYYYNKKDCGSAGIKEQSDSTEGRNATFILDFNYDELMKNYGTANGKTLQGIKVTYEGIINEHAFDGEDALKNTAYTGKNDPYDSSDYDTQEDTEKVFTYGIDVTKVTEDGNTPLAGAEFELLNEQQDAAIKFIKTGDGEYRVAKKGEDKATTTLVVGAADSKVGKLVLKGLATGTYYLKETKAPNGYELLKDSIKIIIEDNEAETPDSDGAGVIDKTGSDTVQGGNIYYQTVVNKKPPIMPVTGGMGTVLFSIVGIVLVAGGITLIVSYRKRNQA